MNLHHTEEEAARLTPEEARAFLQVHAEREAKASEPTPDVPTIEDLAESLHLPLEEAKAILREARARVAATPPPAVRQERAMPLAVILGAATITFILGLRLLAANSVPPALQAAPAMMAPVSYSAGPPNGFKIEIETPSGMTIDQEGEPAKFGTDYRRLDEAGAAALRTRLVDATLRMLDGAEDSAALREARSLAVRLRVSSGQPVTLRVPLKPFTLPLAGNPGGRESLRSSLETTLAAGWPKVIEAMPQ